MKINFASSALLVIDVQNDFCPGGTLAVNSGDEVIEPLNRIALNFAANGSPVIASQDWHPKDHVSFSSSHPGKNPGESIEVPGTKEQMLWPDHCIQNSKGALFHKNLDQKFFTLVVRKGFRKNLDSYSAFFENDRKTSTGLAGFLKELSIENIFMGGLATDYCVFFSAVDALNLKFKTFIINDAVRGVGIPEGSIERAVTELKNMGAAFVDSGDIS